MRTDFGSASTSGLGGGVGNGRENLDTVILGEGEEGFADSTASRSAGFLDGILISEEAFRFISGGGGFRESSGEGDFSSLRDSSGDFAGVAGFGVSDSRDAACAGGVSSNDLTGVAGFGLNDSLEKVRVADGSSEGLSGVVSLPLGDS